MIMNAITFEKGKITFQVFLITLYQWASISYRLNLYNTDRTFKSNSLQFDCLNYHIYRETLAYQELSDIVDEVIPYCFRPENKLEELFEAPVEPFGQKLNFEKIRMINITTQQLLSWSISMEVVERYQLYLNAPNSLLNEEFFNCTQPRFGLRCQYSFAFGEGMSFDQIVEAAFQTRVAYLDSSDIVVQVPCYILLSCHRNAHRWCLDWREICDGKVDCFDEGLDEESCFDMEVNECNEDEYRCHNGLCISEDLWEEGMGDTDCLDRSDRAIEISYIDSCFQDPTFRCEEHSCRPIGKPFSCGDGQCVPTFRECYNGRHALLIDSMAAKGNLTYDCWIAMICLTKLVKKVDERLCKTWLMNSTVGTALKQCGPLFQFPTIPVHSDHIHFLYADVHSRYNDNEILLPDYVCYNQKLCDIITLPLVLENLTCINTPELIFAWDITSNPWVQLIFSVEEYFRSCSILHFIYHDQAKYSHHPSLYNCQNSSKLISKHRIMDTMKDCFEKDDESYENSCLLNDRYRLKCQSTDECWSPLVKDDPCLLDDQVEISFQSFCDGIKKYFYDNSEQEYDDEIGCGDWSCNNIYARCDGFWACFDGRDESSCGRKICPSHTYMCIVPVNHTVICLPSTFVRDKAIHCLGALDEQQDCRDSYSLREISYRFRCSYVDKCLPISRLCDKKDDCPDSEDEFCNNQQITCDEDSAHNRSDVEEVVCALREEENHRIKYFSVHTSSNYPSLEKSSVAEFNHWPTEHRVIRNDNVSQMNNHLWPWYCHRGLSVNIWDQNNNSNRTCMCPPSYYGDLCQYQNQRTSLTLKLASNERRATYVIVSMLMNDEDENIDAYDQFIYVPKQSCSIKLNRYLLFSTRPKDISKNYSVRINVFEKNAIAYVGSWYFPIAFPFLPVNRLGVSLNLSNHLLQRSSECSIACKNGECVKYVNTNKYFCRCYSQWSGIRCNIPINCQSCSSNSICIGSTNNQSICVCSIDRYGSRCELTSTCSINSCQNNGQCVPADVNIHGNNYICICSERFFGQNCQYQKARLDVSLDNMYIPSYLVAYFFTLSNKSDPIETTVLRKLTLFQHIITFHVAIPFQLVFIQVNNKYYLAALQQSPKTDISTSINRRQECIPVKQLLNSTVLKLIPYQRIVHFHFLCYTRFDLTCFIDKDYLCLCTNDHHANCLKFNRERNFQCPLNNYCANKGLCLQDHPTCPSTKICLCRNCFFGNRCQFYAKGLGSTLDEILGYQFRRNTLLSKQPIPVKVAAAVTILIFIVGIINSILSIIIFSRKQSQEVGCGLYLLGSSITSLVTMILFILKFWFLFFSHQDYYDQHNQRHIFEGNCYIEPILKVCLYLDNWFSACLAIERTISVWRGINFNKNLSKRIAVMIIILLFIMIAGHFIPQLINLRIFYDETEERSWCVVKYVSWLETYSTIMIYIHYFGPLTINIFAIIFVIFITAHQRTITQTNRSFCGHFQLIIRKYRYTLMSCGINICLTLPHLIISVILDCNKSSNLLWFYLIGYFLSFLPAAFIFIIYVLPSSHYRKELNELIVYIRRRYEIFKINSLNIR